MEQNGITDIAKVGIADPIFYVKQPPRPQSFPDLEELSQELDNLLHDDNSVGGVDAEGTSGEDAEGDSGEDAEGDSGEDVNTTNGSIDQSFV